MAVTAECINDLKKREIPAFGGRIREWAEGAIHIGLPNQDRDGVAGGQEYEVEYFARKHGITAEQARQLIKEQRKWPRGSGPRGREAEEEGGLDQRPVIAGSGGRARANDIAPAALTLSALSCARACRASIPLLRSLVQTREETMKRLIMLAALCMAVPQLGTALAEKDEMGFIRVLPGQEQ
jgi:hypothetical protein